MRHQLSKASLVGHAPPPKSVTPPRPLVTRGLVPRIAGMRAQRHRGERQQAGAGLGVQEPLDYVLILLFRGAAGAVYERPPLPEVPEPVEQ